MIIRVPSLGRRGGHEAAAWVQSIGNVPNTEHISGLGVAVVFRAAVGYRREQFAKCQLGREESIAKKLREL